MSDVTYAQMYKFYEHIEIEKTKTPLQSLQTIEFFAQNRWSFFSNSIYHRFLNLYLS